MANTEAEAVDFEPEDDDLMDEDGVVDVDASSSPRAPLPKLKSAITGGSAFPSLSAPKKTKGRGFREDVDTERQSRFSGRGFDSLGSDGGPGPQRSVEGWIILVSGVHEEAQDDHLQEAFGEFGEIKNLHLNLDRRTGFVKSPPPQPPPSQLVPKREMVFSSETETFRGWLFMLMGSVSFVGFLFAAVISKLLPLSDNPIISAIQDDSYYCFLVPLTLPILVIAVYFHWLSMKMFKHA